MELKDQVNNQLLVGLFLSSIFLTFPAFSQVFCQQAYAHQWASEIISQPMKADRVEEFIEERTHQQILGLMERPIELVDTGPQGKVYIGPVLIHNYAAFRPDHQRIIRELFLRSQRPSWVQRGADNTLEARFDHLADMKGLSAREVREFYEKDVETFAELYRSELETVSNQGVEVGQVVVEFKDGSRRVSQPFTDYLVEAIWGVTYRLETFFNNLPNTEIVAVHMFHTHPSQYPGAGGALSFADIILLGQIRGEIAQSRSAAEVEAMDFHMYAVARSQNQFIIGHYSEKGYGFE